MLLLDLGRVDLVVVERPHESVPTSAILAYVAHGLDRAQLGEADEDIVHDPPAHAVGVALADDHHTQIVAVEIVLREPRLDRTHRLHHQVRARILPADELLLDRQVLLRIQQLAPRRKPIAPGPPDFLVVRLDRAGDLGMHDETKVGLVHAHPERIGRAQQQVVLGSCVDEPVVDAPPLTRWQSAVVHLNIAPRHRGLQPPDHLLKVLDEREIHNPRPAQLAADRLHPIDLVLIVPHLGRPQRQVRAIDRSGVERHLILAQPQHPPDILSHGPRCRRRQRDRDGLAQFQTKLSDLLVRRAQVMPPLGDAVALIHGQQVHPAGHLIQRGAKVGLLHPLGRGVEQLVLTGRQPLVPLEPLLLAHRRVHELRPDALGPQRRDLIFHQRDQRREHQPDPFAPALLPHRQRRQLEAQRLARSGGHDDQRIAAVHQSIDDLALQRAQGFKPEPVSEGRFEQSLCINIGHGP